MYDFSEGGYNRFGDNMINDREMLASILKITQTGQIGIRSVLDASMRPGLRKALQAQLQGFISTMQSRVAAFGGDAFFEFDLAAINGGDVAKYIVAPQRYGIANIVATGTTEEFALHGENALASLEKDENVERIVVWNTQGKAETDPQAPNGYFVK